LFVIRVLLFILLVIWRRFFVFLEIFGRVRSLVIVILLFFTHFDNSIKIEMKEISPIPQAL